MNPDSPLFKAATAAIYLFLLLPILVVAVVSLNDAPSLAFPPTRISLRWFGAFLTSADFGRATRISLEVAAATALIALALGTAAAYALGRYPVPGRSLVLQFLTSPLILPGIVVALALLQLYAQLGVTPSEASLVAGHVVVALPYAVRTMHAAFATYDTTLDDAAATLGARPLRTFFRVTLPVIKPSLVAGGVFTFAISSSNIMVWGVPDRAGDDDLARADVQLHRVQQRPDDRGDLDGGRAGDVPGGVGAPSHGGPRRVLPLIGVQDDGRRSGRRRLRAELDLGRRVTPVAAA